MKNQRYGIILKMFQCQSFLLKQLQSKSCYMNSLKSFLSPKSINADDQPLLNPTVAIPILKYTSYSLGSVQYIIPVAISLHPKCHHDTTLHAERHREDRNLLAGFVMYSQVSCLSHWKPLTDLSQTY